MSPERLQAGQVDARSDVYALACVLYQCLTGSTPFPGDNVEQQITAHLMAPPPRPSTSQPNIPKQVDQVIATGMAKDPEQRYATTVELASAAHDAITTPIPRPAQNQPPRPASVTNPAPPTPAPAPARRDDQVPPPPAPAPVSQRPADLNRAATQQRSTDWPPVPQTRPAERPPPDVGAPPRPRWRRRIIIAAVLLLLLVVAGLGAGQYIVRSNYYVGQLDGNVVVMRGFPSGIPSWLREPARLGCMGGSDLKVINPGDQTDCKPFKVEYLNPQAQEKVKTGLPAGSLDSALKQIQSLYHDSLLPVCGPAAPAPAPSSKPAAPPATTEEGPPVPQVSSVTEAAPSPGPSTTAAPPPATPASTPASTPTPPPAQQQPGVTCRAAA